MLILASLVRMVCLFSISGHVGNCDLNVDDEALLQFTNPSIFPVFLSPTVFGLLMFKCCMKNIVNCHVVFEMLFEFCYDDEHEDEHMLLLAKP